MQRYPVASPVEKCRAGRCQTSQRCGRETFDGGLFAELNERIEPTHEKKEVGEPEKVGTKTERTG